MKQFYLLSIALVSVSLLTAGCGLGDAKAKAEKCAKQFHKHLEDKNENAMLDLIHPEAMLTDEEAFVELIQRMSAELDIEKVEQSMKFNSSVNNGVTTVNLNFTIHDKKHGEVTEKMVFKETDNGNMRIIGLQYQ